MNGKTLLKTAIATAIAVSAGSVYAFVPNNNTDATAVVYWAGASASTQSAQESVTDFVCDAAAGSVDVLSRSGNWTVACSTSAAKTPTLGDGTILVHKRDGGGSGVGVGPVQSGIQIQFMDASPANCAGAPVAKLTSNNTAYQERTCGATNLNASPDIGTSDAEPELFTGVNVPTLSAPDPVTGPAPFDPTGPAYQARAVLGDLAFNTPVTLSLYKALQAAQFSATSKCHPTNAAYATSVAVNLEDGTTPVTEAVNAPNGDTEACMPSLTKEEIRSIMTGQIKDWTEFKVLDTATNTQTNLQQVANAAGLLGDAQTAVQVCRRANGSGSQAVIGALIEGVNCAAGVAPMKTASTLTKPFVAENSNATNVEKCLDDFELKSNTSTKNASLVKRWAIGVRSTEASATLDQLAVSPFTKYNYRFIKVDGVAPTVENIHRGDYDVWASQSIQLAPSAGVSAAGVFDIIANNAFTVAGIKTLNTDCKHGYGRGCWLGTPKGGAAPTSPAVYDVDLFAANPINNFTRAPGSAKLNICQPALRSDKANAAAPHVTVAPNPNFSPVP